MAVRILVAQNQDENQILKMDSNSRFIVNDSFSWQFLFGPNSSLTNTTPLIKVSARFDDDTFSNIKMVGYLYDPVTASIVNAATCSFKIFKVTSLTWEDTPILTVPGVQLLNNYFYADPNTNLMPSVDFFGGESIMIEATVVRLGITYRDRVYFNHLGIYDNVDRLRKQVEFLDLTKQDE